MRIFLSSTFLDLAEARRQVLAGIERMSEHEGAGMEVFGARPEDPIGVCLAEVRKSGLFVLLVGNRYGSIDPDSGLSVTHLEFQEAKACGIPALALFTPAGAEDPEALKAFRDEVRNSGNTVDEEVAAEELSVRTVTAIMNFLSEQPNRIGQFQAFQEWQDFFSGLRDSTAAFHHEYSLVGREDVLAKMAEFLGGGARVCVLPGAGGVGKSKVLLEYARRHEDGEWRVLFLGPQFELRPEMLQELPATDVFLIVDDAHRRTDLNGLLATMLGPLGERKVKVLLTCRPESKGLIDSVLRGLPDTQKVSLEELQELDRETDALTLAQAALVGDAAQWAEELVKASDGNPLVITVGGKMICDGMISPGLLSKSEKFRSAALEGLLCDLPERLEGVATRRLLEVMAAIAPLRQGDETLEGQLADLLGARAFEATSTLEQL